MTKEYYTSKEFREKIKESIHKNWDVLKQEIEKERKYVNNGKEMYV